MKTPSLIIALALAAACTPQDQDRAAGTEAVAPAAQAPAAAPAAEADATPEPETASGTGEVTAVDPAAATVTIDHGPIDALEWPAMTMTFAAPGVDLASIKAGDKVSFELRQTGPMEATVTSIARDPAQ